ncbi:MAG: methyltransferase [Myxococcales bacterium]|nr:methyltransferase [Myxococcales bacterium]
MRPAGFDLRAVIAQPSFTPSVRDGAALLDLLVGHDEVVTRHATRGLLALGGAGRDLLLRRLAQLAPGALSDGRTSAAGEPGGGHASARSDEQVDEQADEQVDEQVDEHAERVAQHDEHADDHAATRLIAALGAMARHGDPAAIGALVPLLAAPQERRRRAALQALGKLGGDAARGALAQEAVADVRTAVLARWDAGEHSPAERRALTEALGKLGLAEGERRLAELDAGEDRELARRRDRAVIMSRRDQRRAEPSSVRDDVAVPDLELVWSCRGGFGHLLAQELTQAGHRVLRQRQDAVTTRFSGPLSAVFAARLWMQVGLRLPLPEGPLAESFATALTEPLVRALLSELTCGVVRWRLELAGGPRRGAVWEIVQALARRAPELVNEPADTTWTFFVDETARTIELRPRRLADPRFAWRVAELPAASHPTVAAAVAFLAAPRGGERVWDPFVGSGSELIECALLAARHGGPPLQLMGTDLDDAALAAAAQNATAAGVAPTLRKEDARLARPGQVDLIASNPPLGGRLRGDAGALLCEAARRFASALRPGGRLVWITPAPRRTTEAMERAGLAPRPRLRRGPGRPQGAPRALAQAALTQLAQG